MKVDADKLQSRIARLKAPAAAAAGGVASRNKHAPREGDRLETYKGGKLLIPNGEDVACVIKNMSKKGAKAIVATEVALPPTVTLCIPAAGLKRRCRVAWCKEGEIGLTFED